MEENTTVARTALKYGAIFGVIGLVFTAVLYVFDLMMIPLLPYVGFIIHAAGINLAMKEYKNANEGFLSFGEALSLGTLMSTITGFIISIFVIVYTQFIDTLYNEKILSKLQDTWAKSGMDDAKIEMATSWTKMTLSPGISFFLQIIGYVIIGFLISLVVGAILRKNKPVFE